MAEGPKANADPSPLKGVRDDSAFTFQAAQRKGGVQQRNVRKSLREISEHAFRRRIVLLGEQTQIAAHGQEALEKRFRFLHASGHGESAGEPEAARQKD